MDDFYTSTSSIEIADESERIDKTWRGRSRRGAGWGERREETWQGRSLGEERDRTGGGRVFFFFLSFQTFF